MNTRLRGFGKPVARVGASKKDQQNSSESLSMRYRPLFQRRGKSGAKIGEAHGQNKESDCELMEQNFDKTKA